MHHFNQWKRGFYFFYLDCCIKSICMLWLYSKHHRVQANIAQKNVSICIHSSGVNVKAVIVGMVFHLLIHRFEKICRSDILLFALTFDAFSLDLIHYNKASHRTLRFQKLAELKLRVYLDSEVNID